MSNKQNAERPVLVTGATGKQGGAVARQLLERGFPVRAMTREPGRPAAKYLARLGADVVRGDLDDPPSVRPALDGMYGVFSVQNFWETGFEREVRQGVALAELARDVGIRHFVYSSVGSANRHTGLSHFESKWLIEQRIHALDLPFTIFRPVFFMDNWETPGLRAAILDGTFAQPLDPDRAFQQVAVSDVGAFVAVAFDDPETWLGRELDLAGDELTMRQMAETFGRVSGRPVKYVQLSWDQFRAAAGEEYTLMYQWFDRVGYDASIPALRAIYPRLTTFERYLRSHDWESTAQPVRT